MSISIKQSFLFRNPKFTSLFLSLIIYITLLTILQCIQVQENKTVQINELYLEFEKKDKIESPKEEEKKSQNPKKLNTIDTKKKTAVIAFEEQTKVYTDSIETNKLFTPNIGSKDSLSTIDSFIIENPSLISLQIALKDYLNKNGFQRSKNEELIIKIEKSMRDYYKMKYPTPVHKFGEQGSGAGIRIPIDEIIELFE